MSLLSLKTYFTPCCSVSIIDFELVNADWEWTVKHKPTMLTKKVVRDCLEISRLIFSESKRINSLLLPLKSSEKPNRNELNRLRKFEDGNEENKKNISK